VSVCLHSLRSSLQINGFIGLVYASFLVTVLMFIYQETKHNISDMYGHEQCSDEIIRNLLYIVNKYLSEHRAALNINRQVVE